MSGISKLFTNNIRWSKSLTAEDPKVFEKLAQGQTPEFLWIGCADSRVPPNTIVDLPPGEIFVHRNVANLVVHTDLNCLSVMECAIDKLSVPKVVVCGHYGCAGVAAAMGNEQIGLMDHWLRHIKDVYSKNHSVLSKITSEQERYERLCELNVAQQVHNVCSTSIVQNAWKNGKKLDVYGLIFDIKTGQLKDLGLHFNGVDQVEDIFQMVNLSKEREA